MAEDYSEKALTAEMTDISGGWLRRIQEGSEQRLQDWNIQPEDIPAILS